MVNTRTICRNDKGRAMPLKTVKRGKVWYIRGTVKGVSVYESTGETKRAIAEQLRLKKENELLGSSRGERFFAEAAIEYIKKGGEKRYMEKINEMIGHYPLSEIDQNLLDTKARQAYPNVKNSSLARWFYTPVIAVMNTAVKLKWAHYQKFEKPKVTRPAPDWAEIEWLEKFWEYPNDKMRALTTFLPYTGCRISECLSLTWDRVNLDEGWAYIPETKNGEHRTVYLPEIVIERLKAIKDEGQVFKYSDYNMVNKEIKRICKIQKLPYKSSHKVGSHTYATLMRRYAGSDSVGLVATGRWKDPRSTEIYAHAKLTDEAKKASLLPTQSGAKSVQKGNK